MDKEGIVSRTIKEVLAKIGTNLVTGNIVSMMSIRTPAYSHSHLSYLDSARAEWNFLEHFIEQSCKAETFDPIENLKGLAVA